MVYRKHRNPMKSTQLRLGNKITAIFRVGDLEVLSIIVDLSLSHLGDIVAKETNTINDEATEYMEYKPVLLTMEWLKKTVFHLHRVTEGGYDVYRDLYEEQRVHCKDGRFYYKIYNSSRQMNYVHELQNLYFANTGEELFPPKEKGRKAFI